MSLSNDQKFSIVINIIPLLVKILDVIPKTSDVAKAVQKPLQTAIELVTILRKPEVTDDEVAAALDEAILALTLLEAETA